MHAFRQGSGSHQRVADRDSDQGSDQAVGTGVRQAKPPGTDVPEQRCEKKRDQHGDRRAPIRRRQHLRGQQFHQRVGHGDAARHDAHEIQDARENHGLAGRE